MAASLRTIRRRSFHRRQQLFAKQAKERQETRDLYVGNIPDIETAFVRLEETDSLVQIGSRPLRMGVMEWEMHCICFNTVGRVRKDALSLMCEDEMYREHVMNLSIEEMPYKQLFLYDLERFEHSENDEVKLKKAVKSGREKGRLEVCALVITQTIIFLSMKMWEKLTETFVKRKGVTKAYEKLPIYVFEKSGIEYFGEIAESYVKSGKNHIWKEIDWHKFVEKVSIDNVAKKMSKKLYYYGDIREIRYNEDSQTVVMYYVGVRWNGKKHRHRNVPLLLQNE